MVEQEDLNDSKWLCLMRYGLLRKDEKARNWEQEFEVQRADLAAAPRSVPTRCRGLIERPLAAATLRGRCRAIQR